MPVPRTIVRNASLLLLALGALCLAIAVAVEQVALLAGCIGGILLGAALLSAVVLVWVDGKPIQMRSGDNLPKEGHKTAYAIQLLVVSLFGWVLVLGCATKLLQAYK